VEANFMDGAQALQALDDPKNLLVAELPSRVERGSPQPGK
jgi:hypothetical protein